MAIVGSLLKTNGANMPLHPVDQISPGSVVCFGDDDDMTVLVISNQLIARMRPDCDVVDKYVRELVYLGCFCDPGSYEYNRLITQAHGLKDTVAVVMMP